jgi:NAD(P)H-dependent FMN reductase
LALIYGSTREGRFCDKVASWAIGELARRAEFSVHVIDPALPASAEARQQVRDAEAFTVVTPEYNHSYPAPLKLLIDSINEEWHAKPVAFISYGGISGGIHAVAIRDTVGFANAWTQFDDMGLLRHPDAARKSLSVRLHRLAWWAKALHKARETVPHFSGKYLNQRNCGGRRAIAGWWKSNRRACELRPLDGDSRWGMCTTMGFRCRCFE